MRTRYVVLGLVVALLLARPVGATTITLDFETAATGLNITTAPLVTSLGTIAAIGSLKSFVSVITESGTNMLNVEPTLAVDLDVYGELDFGFPVSFISFIYYGRDGGVFNAQALGLGFDVIDSFFDGDATGDNPGPTVTLMGSGIRRLRFADFPNGARLAAIDNVQISDTVPEPASVVLIGTGFVGTGVRRYLQRRRQ